METRERLALEPQQVRALLTELGEPYRTMVMLAVLSGLRGKSSACGGSTWISRSGQSSWPNVATKAERLAEDARLSPEGLRRFTCVRCARSFTPEMLSAGRFGFFDGAGHATPSQQRQPSRARSGIAARGHSSRRLAQLPLHFLDVGESEWREH